MLLSSKTLLSPSNASPPLNDPSPITAIIFSFSPFKSLAFARPQARLIDVEVCPIVKKSCSLSLGEVKPLTEPYLSASIKASFLPVNIL